MNINDAKIILNLHNTLSINKTAEFLNYVPQTIYKCLDSLEREFGNKIVNRSIANGISFTSFGESIIPELDEIINHYTNMRNYACQQKTKIAYFAPITAKFNLDIHSYDIHYFENIADFVPCYSLNDAYNMLKGHVIDMFADYQDNSNEFYFLPLLKDQVYAITTDANCNNVNEIDLSYLYNKTILVDSTSPKIFNSILSELEDNGCTIVETKLDSQLWYRLNYPDTYFLTCGQFKYYFSDNYLKIAIKNQYNTIGFRYNNNNYHVIDFAKTIKSTLKEIYRDNQNIID